MPNGISSFRVIIDSPLLPESELQGIGLTSDFDLVSPGGYADKLSGLGFPVHIGDETSVSFNISSNLCQCSKYWEAVQVIFI